MSPTKKHQQKKNRRTQRSNGGRKITGPFAYGVPNAPRTFANVTFGRRWFQDIPESNKGTLTDFKRPEGLEVPEKIMMAKLTVNVSEENMKKFKIPGPIVVTDVKFEKTRGYSHGAYLKITAADIGRPDLRSVAYVASDSDYFELTAGGGAIPGLNITAPTGTLSAPKIGAH